METRRPSQQARQDVPDELPKRQLLERRDERKPFDERDLRGVGWLVLERIFFADMAPAEVSASATLIRALTALGDAPADQEEQLAEIELRGMLMNGFQPRSPEEWARASKMFGETSMEEFRRWKKLPPREPTPERD